LRRQSSSREATFRWRPPKLIAPELFREDKISLGRAAGLCRMPIEAFMDYAGEHGAALHYGLDELEQDSRNIARLGL
jgi:predicted HTH domain antitoxin